MRVPLLIHAPFLSPHHVPVKRSVVDLVPTLLDLMRIPQPDPGELSGRTAMGDLLAVPGDSFEERDVYLDMPEGPYTHMRRAIIHGVTPGLKLIHFGGRHYELYDLATDPAELEDLAGDEARLGPMIQALQAKRATLKEVPVKPDAPAPLPSEPPPMNRWFPRVVLAVAGALVGALCIAMAEAWSVSRQWSMSFGSVLCGDFAVLVPLATPVGIAVWASAGLLDPHGRRGIRLAMSALAALRGRRRAWAASIALVAPPGHDGLAGRSPHAARSAFAFGEPPASGVEAAVVSVVFLVFGSAAAFAVLPVLSRSVIGSVNPFLAAGCGLTYAAAATLIGIRPPVQRQWLWLACDLRCAGSPGARLVSGHRDGRDCAGGVARRAFDRRRRLSKRRRSAGRGRWLGRYRVVDTSSCDKPSSCR